jgi:peroxiredoxin
LWQRQLVLGPAPEFCLLSAAPVSLPAGVEAQLVNRLRVWPGETGSDAGRQTGQGVGDTRGMADSGFHEVPADLPIPTDDGAAEGIEGRRIPSLKLLATTGAAVDLAAAASGTLVLYVYPRTGTPGEPVPAEWDAIPGARGCTPENCAFRDHARELAKLGATVHGLSAQPLREQRAFAEREAVPFALLNDAELRLAGVLGLPTFEFQGSRFYRRLTLIACAGCVEKVFYPVFPPGAHVGEVLEWLRANAR